MNNYTSCIPLEQKKKEYDRYLRGLEKSPISNCISSPLQLLDNYQLSNYTRYFLQHSFLTSKTYVSDSISVEWIGEGQGEGACMQGWGCCEGKGGEERKGEKRERREGKGEREEINLLFQLLESWRL